MSGTPHFIFMPRRISSGVSQHLVMSIMDEESLDYIGQTFNCFPGIMLQHGQYIRHTDRHVSGLWFTRSCVGSNQFPKIRSVSGAGWLDSSKFLDSFLCSDCQCNFHNLYSVGRLTVAICKFLPLSSHLVLRSSSSPQCLNRTQSGGPYRIHSLIFMYPHVLRT
jgi:hypothetical protein